MANTADLEVNAEEQEQEEQEEQEDEELELVETDEAAEKESKPAPKKPMIPKSRLDEVLQKNRELERRLAEQTQEKQTTQQRKAHEALEAKLETLDDECENARLDGDKEKLKQLRRELRKVERQLFQPDYTQALEQAASVAKDASAEQVYIANLEVMYPQLAGDSSTYDDELVQSIVDLRNGFLNGGGHTPISAMKRSIAMHQHLLEASNSAAAKARTQDALRKAVSTANTQPPTTKNVGDPGTKFGKSKPPNVESMTPEQFAKLTSEQRKRLRGDFV